jgi:hypothetical protein
MSMKFIVAGAAVVVALGLVGFVSTNDLVPPTGCTGATPNITAVQPAR